VKPVVENNHPFAADIVEDLLGIDPLKLELVEETKLREFVSITVFEMIDGVYQPHSTFGVNEMHEVELMDGFWRWSPEQQSADAATPPPPRPAHHLCRRWQGEDCSHMAVLEGTSEWHATAMYRPRTTRTGGDVRLKIALVVNALIDGVPGTRVYEEFVSVHLAEAPLPRFDERWVYGDLHYHSQGTDNDGESAYNYRGTLQAMNALGLDFAFATDHTSNSRQIMAGELVDGLQLVKPVFRGLRDLSPDRFAWGIGAMNGMDGGNREVLSVGRPRAGVGSPLGVPQLFLGSEVDVIPEFAWGHPPGHDYSRACEKIHPVMKVLELIDDKMEIVENLPSLASAHVCQADRARGNPFLLDETSDGRMLIRDVQGPVPGHFLSTSFYGRQHLVHLPEDPLRTDAVVLGNTSDYGGATRRLRDVLEQDLARDRKGAAFLAHPFSRAQGSGVGRAGPDLVPYSKAQLRDAFASPDILGFQAWNSNGQQSTSLGEGDSGESQSAMVPVADLDDWLHERQQRKVLFFDLLKWDEVLLWGLDPDETASLDWLAPGEPRRFFFAGGSDAHGDLNYRRSGYFLGNSSISDTALGTPRNLVFAGEPEGETLRGPGGVATPHSQAQIVSALRSGHFSVTDGPAVRIAYDVNGNGVIDDEDVPMGGVATESGCSLTLLVEWLSTREFGPVETIDLKLGVAADEQHYGMVYQTTREEPVVPGNASLWTDLDGNEFHRTPQVLHWYDPTRSQLTIEVGPDEGMAGLRAITIDPDAFPVGRAHAVCVEDYEEMLAAHRAEQEGASGTSVSYATTVGFDEATIFDGATSGTTALLAMSSGFGTGPHAVSTDQIGTGELLGEGGDGTFPEEDGPNPPLPDCERVNVFEEPTTPDRFFVRAEIRNGLAPGTNPACDDPTQPLDPTEDPSAQCLFRRAVTNPVWVHYRRAGTHLCLDRTGGTTTATIEEETGGASQGSEPTPTIEVDSSLVQETTTLFGDAEAEPEPAPATESEPETISSGFSLFGVPIRSFGWTSLF
jgi:hypothetical protein